MKIVADENIPALQAYFGHLGELVTAPGRLLEPEMIRDADVLLVRSVTRVDSTLLGGSSIRFVGSATSGTDHVDQAMLRQCGTAFAHAAGSNAQSVVEYVLAALCEHPTALQAVLTGEPVGVVGYGHVGRRLAQVLVALGVHCLVSDPWLAEDNGGSLEGVLEASAEMVDLDRVLACPVVSLHCELTDRPPWPSRHLINESRLSRLAPGTLLINASRGPVVDNIALRRRLQASSDIDVVLDVWENEPVPDLELVPLCSLATQHIAGYSLDAKLNATAQLAQAVHDSFQLDNSEKNLVLDALAKDSITLADSEDLPATIASLMRARYRIREDDRNFREALATVSHAEIGSAFDALRRDYPERREVAGSRVIYQGSDERVLQLLASLGCERLAS